MLELWNEVGSVTGASNDYNLQAFIGIDTQNRNNNWLTIDNEIPEYINWSSTWCGHQQPDSPSTQQCGSLLKEGGMDDIECFLKLAFFCKREN